jgi:hypothetical protein
MEDEEGVGNFVRKITVFFILAAVREYVTCLEKHSLKRRNLASLLFLYFLQPKICMLFFPFPQ